MICSYLLYSGFCDSLEEAILYFAKKRTSKNVSKKAQEFIRIEENSIDRSLSGIPFPIQTVSGRSQLRFLSYYFHYLQSPDYYDIYTPPAIQLKLITISNVS